MYCIKVTVMKVFYGREPPRGESTTAVRGVSYQRLSVILLKQPNGELLVAVVLSQLHTMALETVESIDCPLLPSFTGQ